MTRINELETLRVQAFPSGTNCLSWSEDGDLAIATGDYVHIYVPKGEKSHQQSNDPTSHRDWTSTRLKINTFTPAEWPVLPLSPTPDFSVGEEQSISSACSIAWSPPGLGMHRRCILGILTTNSVLSLWESNGMADSWRRAHVVNKALDGYFDRPTDNTAEGRGKHRIRSFCWSPPVHEIDTDEHSPKDPSGPFRWGISYLAVATDANYLFIFKLQKSGVDHTGTHEWQTQVLSSQCLGSSVPMLHPRAIESHSIFANFIATSGVTSDIAWSPWLHDMSSAQFMPRSIIAVVRGIRLDIIQVAHQILNHEESSTEHHSIILKQFEDKKLSEAMQESSGPLAWCPSKPRSRLVLSVVLNKKPSVVVFSEAGAFETMTTLISPKIESGNLEARQPPCTYRSTWVSNHSLAPHTSKQGYRAYPQLHLTGQTTDNAFTIVNLKSGECSELLSAPWSVALHDATRSFGASYGLEDATRTRIYGLASNGKHVAICFSVHPTDIIEYITPSLELSHVAFHPIPGTNEGLGTCSPNSDELNRRKEIFRWLILSITKRDIKKLSTSDLMLLWTQFRILFQLSPDAQFFSPFLTTLENLGLHAEYYTKHMLNMSSQEVVEGLNGLMNGVIEFCEICHSELDCESSEETMCENGHAYSRCSLSLLAIQEPGISKRCSLCERQYLDIAKMEREGALSTNLQSSINSNGNSSEGLSRVPVLARQLLETFDTCCFCEGKFYG